MCGEKTILYYPSIKLEDGPWLRNAILYWDKVATIVPGQNYALNGNVEMEYLQENEVYQPIYPIELEENRELCDNLCLEVREKLSGRREYLSRRGKKQEKRNLIHEEKLAIEEGSMLHLAKTPNTILDYLMDEGIVKRNGDGPWLNIRNADAHIYMSILAKYLARLHDNMEIGTDRTNKFYNPYIIPKRNEDVERQFFLNVALQEILPTPNIQAVPLQDILEFKNEHKKELYQFRKKLEKFQRELKKCNDVQALREEIEIFRDEINKEMYEFDKILYGDIKGKVMSSVKMLLPIGAGLCYELWAISRNIPQEQMACGGAIVSTLATMMTSRMPDTGVGNEINETNAYLFGAYSNDIIRKREIK